MKFLKFCVLGLLVLCLATANAKSRFKTNPVRLVLPPAIYAVDKQKINIYFDNVILTQNIKNYLIDVTCSKGRQDTTRWRYTPKSNEIGKYSFNIKVLNDQNKIIAKKSTTLYVSPSNSGSGKNISILLVGDSFD